MIGRDEIIEIGSFNKPHGVGGEITATIDCDIDVVERLSCLVSGIDGIWIPFYISSIRPKGIYSMIAKLDGLDSEEEIRKLVNKPIMALKREWEELVEEADSDELPTDFFIGYTIIDMDTNSVIGKIIDVDAQTENVLFVVEDDNDREILIPAADELVVSLDMEEKRIVMNLPEGLTE